MLKKEERESISRGDNLVKKKSAALKFQNLGK